MRIARAALEIAVVLAAVFATFVGIVLVGGVGLVPHTVANGREIEVAFREAFVFVDQHNQLNRRLPTELEFHQWREGKDKWVSSMELFEKPNSNPEISRRWGVLPQGTYALSVWRGEWTEYYVPGKGSTIDPAVEMYISSIGLALVASSVAALLWLCARWLKRRQMRRRVAR